MPRNFITITQEEEDERIAESLRSREKELFDYDFEKKGHEEALAALGDIEWTDELKEYKGLTRDVMIARATANGLTEQTIKLISDLMAKDKHSHEIHAINLETSKSERHYDSILKALPEGKRRDDALLKVKDKERAQKAKQLGMTIEELDAKEAAIKEVKP